MEPDFCAFNDAAAALPGEAPQKQMWQTPVVVLQPVFGNVGDQPGGKSGGKEKG